MNQLVHLYFQYALFLFSLLWIAAAGRSILIWLHYIQLKQYRPDRIFDEMKTPVFWKLFFSSYRSVLIGFLLAWELLLRANIPSPKGVFDLLFVALSLFFLVQVLHSIHQYRRKMLRLPAFTKKIWFLFVAALALEIWIAYQYQFWPEQLLVLEILQPFIVLLLFGIAFLPNLLLMRKRMAKARQKIKSHPKLVVIGITGSYGKTTMKDYLSHLLSSTHKVLKTPEHLNVDAGIAKLIIDELHPDHQFFVVEMGAYRKGEIARICELVSPSYGVLTGLSNQHLSLFGSLAEIEQTKFELVEAIGDEKQIFANADSQPLMQAFSRRDMLPKTFSVIEGSDFKAESVRFASGKTVFSLDGADYEAPIFGRGHLTNLAGAIAVARSIGLPQETIQSALNNLPTLPGTMEIQELNGSLIINDTYNANTYGILTSLTDLAMLTTKRKIVVFDQVIELGDQANEDHRRIARKIAETANYAMILSTPQHDIIEHELLAAGFSQDRLLQQSELKRLAELCDDQTIILFEGRGAAKILAMLRQYLKNV